jgi:hypothetical protein
MQIAMIFKINTEFELDADSSKITSVLTGIMGGSIGTGGKILVSNCSGIMNLATFMFTERMVTTLQVIRKVRLCFGSYIISVQRRVMPRCFWIRVI